MPCVCFDVLEESFEGNETEHRDESIPNLGSVSPFLQPHVIRQESLAGSPGQPRATHQCLNIRPSEFPGGFN